MFFKKINLPILILIIFVFLIFPQMASAKSLSSSIKDKDMLTFYEHGITFEYPSNWKLKKEFLSDSCIFVSNLPSANNNYEDRLIINIYPYTEKMSNEELTESVLKGFKNYKLLGRGTVTIGGYKGLAIKVLCSSNTNPNIKVQIEDFLIPVGDKIYEIYTVSLPNRFEIAKKEAHKLVSSIDFYFIDSKTFKEEKQSVSPKKAVKVQPISSTKPSNQSRQTVNKQNPSAKTQLKSKQEGMISKSIDGMNFQYPKSWKTQENKAEQSFTAILPTADNHYEDKIKIITGNLYNLSKLSMMALPEAYTYNGTAPIVSEYPINGEKGILMNRELKSQDGTLINIEQIAIKVENNVYLITITSPPDRFEKSKKEAYKLIDTITFE